MFYSALYIQLLSKTCCLLINLLDSIMALVDLDVAQTRIDLHPGKSLRQLSSCRLANKRIHAYHYGIAMCVVHPALLMLALLVVLCIRSKSFKKAGSNNNIMETTRPPPVIETTVVMCVYAEEGQMYLLVIIRQRLLRSGDVELNPGPLDGEQLTHLHTCPFMNCVLHAS